MANINVSIKMRRIFIIPGFVILYRMYIGRKPNSFLFAVWAIFSIKAVWINPSGKFPYVLFSRISSYGKISDT